MAFFILFFFLMMLMFGGIAVDVMRFETRRVAMQQTMDRAALAAASITQTRDGKVIAEDWFATAGLDNPDLVMVDYSTPTVSAINDAGLRRVTISARVRSNNFFMHLLNVDYLEGPTASEAAQGVSEIEVMLVLDITGSMGDPAVSGGSVSKIQVMRDAAEEFVSIVKSNDTKNGVSIGLVPYAAQVNIPANLRQRFNVQDVSSWNGVANAGVPNINCIEIPTSTYGTTALPLTLSMRMAAVADSNSATTTTPDPVAPLAPTASSRACTTKPDTGTTAYNDELVNHVFLPTKDGEQVKTRIQRLTAAGNTYIAVGMRWGTALLDQAARPIYTAIGDPTVAGRPADNASVKTRKIIILMTDGEHVTNNHILDAYKSGLSPIWRGTDGNFAIRYTTGGGALTGGTRPGYNTTSKTYVCSGWDLGVAREYFIPHLKAKSVKAKFKATDAEGVGTGTDAAVTAACDPRAWQAAPTWKNSSNVTIVTTQLDWSEVWRYVRVSWVVRQLYMRSGVSGGTDNYNTVMDMFRTTYLTGVSNMNALLQQNCTAARSAGIEIYGIAFAAPTNGQAQINGCSSSPKENYYFNASDNGKLLAAFRAIATDISELRLTQ